MDISTSKTIEKIYDTLINPAEWQTALDSIVDLCGALGANVFCFDQFNHELNQSFNSQLLVEKIPDYFEMGLYQYEEPIFPAFFSLNREDGFTDERTLIEEMAQRRAIQLDLSHVRRWLVEGMGVHNRVISSMSLPEGSKGLITMHLGESYLETQAQSIHRGNILLPHLSKALCLARPYHMLYERYQAVLDVLDRFKLGVFVLNADSSTLLTNLAAKEILDNGDAFKVDSLGRLTAQGEKALGVIETFTQNTKSCFSHQGFSFSLPRKSDASPYVCQLCETELSSDGEKGKKFLLVVIDPDKSSIIDPTGLCSVFGLSPSESNIVDLILNGLSNNEISDVRDVSIETVKSQVKSIMRKVNCNNRIQIVKKAHELSIPIE